RRPWRARPIALRPERRRPPARARFEGSSLSAFPFTYFSFVWGRLVTGGRIADRPCCELCRSPVRRSAIGAQVGNLPHRAEVGKSSRAAKILASSSTLVKRYILATNI